MFQWRFDNYRAISLLYFLLREMYISNLRSPGVTNRSEMKVNQIGSEQTVSRDSFNYAREVKAADMSNLQVVIYWVS